MTIKQNPNKKHKEIYSITLILLKPNQNNHVQKKNTHDQNTEIQHFTCWSFIQNTKSETEPEI